MKVHCFCIFFLFVQCDEMAGVVKTSQVIFFIILLTRVYLYLHEIILNSRVRRGASCVTCTHSVLGLMWNEEIHSEVGRPLGHSEGIWSVSI